MEQSTTAPAADKPSQSLCQGRTHLRPARMEGSGSHGGAGGQQQLPEDPSGPEPGGHEAACRKAARSFPLAAQALLTNRLRRHPHPKAPAWERRRWCPHAAPANSPAQLHRGSPDCVAWRVPHPKHHTLLPAGQILRTSPETHTLLWGLCLNSLQMQKAQLEVFTHRDKEQLLTAAPAWPPFTPLFLLRQPTSLLFLLSSFPRFCAALPGIPCATQQPALLHSSPSLLLSHHFFGICCSQRSRN